MKQINEIITALKQDGYILLDNGHHANSNGEYWRFVNPDTFQTVLLEDEELDEEDLWNCLGSSDEEVLYRLSNEIFKKDYNKITKEQKAQIDKAISRQTEAYEKVMRVLIEEQREKPIAFEDLSIEKKNGLLAELQEKEEGVSNYSEEELKEYYENKDKEPETKYVILGAVDNGTPNVDVFYSSKDEAKAKAIYNKLQRLDALQDADTEDEKDKHEKLYQDLQEEGIELFSEDDWIEDMPVDWELNGLYEFKEVEV